MRRILVTRRVRFALRADLRERRERRADLCERRESRPTPYVFGMITQVALSTHYHTTQKKTSCTHLPVLIFCVFF